METRISELKAKALALQKNMDDKEETLRSLSEKMGNMSKQLNDYQIKYEENLKIMPQVKDRLSKKEKLIEQEKHDGKIINDKIIALQKQKVKLMQDQNKLEQKVTKKCPAVKPYDPKQGSPGQSKIQNYFNQSVNAQTIEGNQKQSRDSIEQKIDQNQLQQNQKKNPQINVDNTSQLKEKEQLDKKISTEEQQEEDDDKSDEDCDVNYLFLSNSYFILFFSLQKDILKRIKANLKNDNEKDENEEEEEENAEDDEDDNEEEDNDEEEESDKDQDQNNEQKEDKDEDENKEMDQENNTNNTGDIDQQ